MRGAQRRTQRTKAAVRPVESAAAAAVQTVRAEVARAEVRAAARAVAKPKRVAEARAKRVAARAQASVVTARALEMVETARAAAMVTQTGTETGRRTLRLCPPSAQLELQQKRLSTMRCTRNGRPRTTSPSTRGTVSTHH
jgi:hypothetical protein